jgi:hypothetical protein
LKAKTLGNIPIPKGVKVVEIVTTTGEKLRFPTFETAKLGEITKAMESRALQTLDGVKKAISLPKFEKLSFRIDPGEVKPHFLTGHKVEGGRLAQSVKDGGKKTIFPEWMSEKQIYSAIEDAYKNSTKSKSTKYWNGERTIEPVCNKNQNGFYFNNGIYDRFNSRSIRDFR